MLIIGEGQFDQGTYSSNIASVIENTLSRTYVSPDLHFSIKYSPEMGFSNVLTSKIGKSTEIKFVGNPDIGFSISFVPTTKSLDDFATFMCNKTNSFGAKIMNDYIHS